MNISFNCATLNVGTAQDYYELQNKLRPDISKIDSFQEYEEKLKTKIPELVENQDFVCFQEIGSDCRHFIIENELAKRNFKLVANERLGIAFRSDKFELLAHGPTFEYDPYRLTWWQYQLTSITDQVSKLRPSYFADLQHKISGTFVRVVSAHFKGFNVKRQKEMTVQCRGMVDGNQKIDLTTKKIFGPRMGDLEVTAMLFSIDELTEEMPDVTILGVDANTTAKLPGHSQFRAHPKRLRKLDDQGYVRDLRDNEPTLTDKADGLGRKYDYLLALFNPDLTGSEIHSYADFKLNDKNPKNFISDHVPVKGCVSYTI